MSELILDGEGEILGRVASLAAKKALQGETVVIVNCDKVLISGNKRNIIGTYLSMRQKKVSHFPSIPERIMKRTVRGMINYKSGRGEAAFEKLRCYNETPKEYAEKKKIKLGNKKKNLMNLKELGRELKRGR